MAFDAFLKLDGIKGEAQDHKHKDEIDVKSWTWGVAQPASFGGLGGGGAGKVNIQDLTIIKPTDLATPVLMEHCIKGKHIAKGKLVIRKAGGEQLEYLTISLENILISSHFVGGAGDHPEELTENVALNFSKIEVEYKSQTDKGAAGPGAILKWDVKGNK